MGKFVDVGKKGVHFQDVANRIARYYRRKGYSPKKARSIGRRTAGKIFWSKFGRRRGRRIIRTAKRKARRVRRRRRRRRRRSRRR